MVVLKTTMADLERTTSELGGGERVADPVPVQAPGQATTQKPALFVATPCYSCQLTHAFATSLLRLQAECIRRGITCFCDFMGNESLIPRGRNVLAARFLKRTEFTHLLFIDADIAFDPATVFRMLDFDKDVTASLYPKKSIDWESVKRKLAAGEKEPVSQQGLDFNVNIQGTARVEQGFVKVLDAATGFMLIKRDVFERLEKAFPTLRVINDIPGSRDEIPDYHGFFDLMNDEYDDGRRRPLSEDYAFCRRVQQVGANVYVDYASALCHIGNSILHPIRKPFASSA